MANQVDASMFAYNPYEVVIGTAKRQTVLTGSLLDGAMAELAVVNVDKDQRRQLRIFRFDGSAWREHLETMLRPEVVFVDVPGPELFSAPSQGVRVAVPNDEEYSSWLVDLNRDGKRDILMHQPFILRDGHGSPERPPGTEQQQVMILVSQ